MSTAVAIASVTAVLKAMLHDGLSEARVSDGIGDWLVSALPPDRVDVTAGAAKSHLNLFLHQVTPNTAWRNEGLPGRDPQRGERLSNRPWLALDLHYLLTAFGTEELYAEVLLGHGMQVLHEHPVLAREQVRRALSPGAGGSTAPAALQAAMAGADLAEQPDLIRLMPEPMSTEEISKLWPAFQARYRPTAAYMASPVLIEARPPVRGPAPPVLDRRVHAVPMRRPVIREIRVQTAPGQEILSGVPAESGQRLVLEGTGLRGEQTEVQVGIIAVTPAAEELDDHRILVPLPAGLAAGPQAVRVVHHVALGEPPLPHRGVESAVALFLLVPRLAAPPVATVAPGADGRLAGQVRVTLDPAPRPGQRVTLLLGPAPPASPPDAGAPAASYAFPAEEAPQSPPLPPGTLDVPVAGVLPGRYIVRLRVDAAESLPQRDDAGRPTGPLLVLP
jgi:hypothetical protein